jgi:hypothetical protein
MNPTDAQFTRTNGVFTMTCAVQIRIQAGAEIIWSLLTDAPGFPRWNSTITRIEGAIREGERLRLHVPGTNRTFTPTVSGVVTNRRMIWSDGLPTVFKGVRNFALEAREEGSTNFFMEERFSGVVFALTRGLLPDFQPIFETYAMDLKRESERVALERAGIAGPGGPRCSAT